LTAGGWETIRVKAFPQTCVQKCDVGVCKDVWKELNTDHAQQLAAPCEAIYAAHLLAAEATFRRQTDMLRLKCAFRHWLEVQF
jgi:hypothetical protein